MFDVLRGTPLAEDIASVLRKLEQQMTDAERADYATFGDRFAYLPDVERRSTTRRRMLSTRC